MKLDDFSKDGPPLDLFAYFEGETEAWGWFEDRFGTVRRQFYVDIKGTVTNDTLTLDESFLYKDGEKAKRVWSINRQGENLYQGQADDVIGLAQGATSGNSLNWTYTLALPIGDSLWHVDFDDWMFLQDERTLLNRAVITKWGIELGRVSIFFRKPESDAAPKP